MTTVVCFALPTGWEDGRKTWSSGVATLVHRIRGRSVIFFELPLVLSNSGCWVAFQVGGFAGQNGTTRSAAVLGWFREDPFRLVIP